MQFDRKQQAEARGGALCSTPTAGPAGTVERGEADAPPGAQAGGAGGAGAAAVLSHWTEAGGGRGIPRGGAPTSSVQASFLDTVNDWFDARPNEQARDDHEDALDELEDFRSEKHATNYSRGEGGHFRAEYDPVAGALNITVYCQYEFQSGVLTEVDMSTVPATLRTVQASWSKEEMEDWKQRFQSVCQSTWSEQHRFFCQRDFWESLRADVRVSFVNDKSDGAVPPFRISVRKGATTGEDSRAHVGGHVASMGKEDVEPSGLGGRPVAAHEAGHMLGLGDEYAADGYDGAAQNAPIRNSELIEAEFGHTVLRGQGDPDSIMAGGARVLPMHGVVFLDALRKATAMNQWGFSPRPPRRPPEET